MSPIAWRFAVVSGLAAGLAVSPAVPATARSAAAPMLAVGLGAGLALWLARPRIRSVAAAWIGLLALAAGAAGLAMGTMRLAVIDGGALHGPTGRQAVVRGFVTAAPRRSDGEVRVRVATVDGRLALEGREPVADLEIGSEVAATGTLAAPAQWEAGYLAIHGIHRVLRARSIRPTEERRGGLAGITDSIRNRAGAALGRGTGEPQGDLLRGFLLGQDDRIDSSTVEDFKRAGLAHLLAVSGDCVMLLALLGAFLLAIAGVPLRARLLALLTLICVYVPVAGGGPSIQRAGIMGAAGVVAALAGRPRWRWYAVLLAAVLTLLLNPRSVVDPSWQLSFAAVAGILLFAAPVRDLVVGFRTPGGGPSPARRAFAEGAGVTVAATLATAPLFAHHFGAVSLAALPANLLALPAVAPMMWLGMLAAIGGQVPGFPVEPFTGLAGLLAAYVAQVAHWLAAPGWSQVGIELASWPQVVAAYAALGAAMATAAAWARRHRGAASPRGAGWLTPIAAAILVVCIAITAGSRSGAPTPEPGLRVVVFDVGQGDAILLDPADADPILIDGGPPGAELARQLGGEGVSRLAAAVVTHDQSDHAGGLEELVAGGFPVHRLLYAGPAADLARAARVAGAPALRIAEGSQIRSGSLRLDVLWPPRSALEAPSAEPNETAAVLLARWRSFAMLLAADAEAEAVPLDPGPVDVLKVAHHGSADAGLDALLDRTVPRLAVISVGAGNPYGHPTPQTLATLADHDVRLLRTDEVGDVTIDVSDRGWSVATG